MLDMKIGVIGVGAIGGWLAAKLAAAGEEVRVVARGAHLAAIRERGLILREEGREIVVRVAASDRIADLGACDLVILGMKAHQVAPVAAEVGAMLGPLALILTAQNGLPWWYFFKHGGPHEGARLQSVDPGGAIADHLPIDRVIGSVVYAAAEIERPGVIRHSEGNRFTVGELDGANSERIELIAAAFTRAGFKSPVATDLRTEIWTKLWGNLSFNPISALTHATMVDMCRFAPTRALVAGMMREAQQVGEAFGVRVRISIDKRIAGAETIGAHKTSMLQDIENGRAIEADALIGSVIELARLAGVATPHIDAVYALVKLLSQTLADNNGKLAIAPL
jgi:2-dehydropantoate 2-reductase